MRVFKTVLLVFVLLGLAPASAPAGYRLSADEHAYMDVSLHVMGWYQFVEDGVVTAEGEKYNLNDFQLRRVYLTLKGGVTGNVSYFVNVAADRIGQEGLDNPGYGLGTGVAFRDGWIQLKAADELMFKLGRMYVPLTRSYGTTTTFGLFTLDLPIAQGGIRGGIFYPGKVGRDDGVALWGNILDGLVQYRILAGEGVEGTAQNPRDELRYAGRVVLSLLGDKETGWFNKGTYLGEKKVLALGAGFDSQRNLGPDANRDYQAATFDLFLDYPVSTVPVTLESSYTSLRNGAPGTYLDGLDAEIFYAQAGFLVPGNTGPGKLQPYGKYELINEKDAPEDKQDVQYFSAGANYYLKGHDAKVSVDYTIADRIRVEDDHYSIVTLQLAVGF